MKSRIPEGMLTSSLGLEVSTYFRYNISFVDPPLG